MHILNFKLIFVLNRLTSLWLSGVMKILWLDINSSYSHSSVALPAIHAQVNDRNEWEWCVVRATINDNPGTVAAAVAECKPDVIAATFWLFTHSMQIEVLSRTVELLDDVMIVCGGPEFLGDNEGFLRSHPYVTAVIRGEGEIAFPKFITSINNPEDWDSIEGLCWLSKENAGYHDNGIARVIDFASLRYPEESSFFSWDKPFVQLETTRGCFNTCAFCVSGGEKPVRYQSIGQIRSRLENIHSHGIKDIRVLDRTFNYDLHRACDMLDLFAEYAGKMRFHLEIHPALITDTLKYKLSSMPSGLLHLEAGIQSLDSKVLSESGRKGSLESSFDGLVFLCNAENLQVHADLIAGLPEYSLTQLCADIVSLIKTEVDELQIESLKVLPGTQMRKLAESKRMKFSSLPPYEILRTPAMSVSDMGVAMKISRMVDLYYNSSCWQKITRDLISDNDEFLVAFTRHLDRIMLLDSPVSLERRGFVLYEYIKDNYPYKLADMSIAWIKAGFSLKKEPAGYVVKIKHPDSYLMVNDLRLAPQFGEAKATHRYYLLTAGEEKFMFGYDSEIHHPEPVFMAKVISLHDSLQS